MVSVALNAKHMMALSGPQVNNNSAVQGSMDTKSDGSWSNIWDE